MTGHVSNRVERCFMNVDSSLRDRGAGIKKQNEFVFFGKAVKLISTPPMKTSLYLFLLLGLAAATPVLRAQQESIPLAGIPPQIIPIVKNIEAKYTPAQLMQMVQTATPTGWKIIQEKARLTEAGKPQGFTVQDFQSLPEKEQQALVAAIQPVIMEAVGKLTPQEQMQLLTMAKDFDANSVITPVMNLATKKDVKK
jgi:hypothetical protein